MKTKFLKNQKSFIPARLVYFSVVIGKNNSEQLGRHEGELMSTEEIRDIRNIVQIARDNIVEARLRVQTLNRQKSTLEKSLMSLQGHQKVNQEEMAQKQVELETVKMKIEALERTIKELEKEIEGLESQLKLLDAKLTKLKELHTNAKNGHEYFSKKLAENRKQLHTIEDQLQALEASKKLMSMVQNLDIDLLANRSFEKRHFEIEDGLAKIHRAQVEALRKTKADLEDQNRRLTTAAAQLNNIELNQAMLEIEKTHATGRKGSKEAEKTGKDAQLGSENLEAQRLGGEIDNIRAKIEERADKIKKRVKEITENLQERKLKFRHIELKVDSLARVEADLDQTRASIETHLLGNGKEKILLNPSVLMEMEESLKGTYTSFLEILLNHEDLPQETKDKARRMRLTISKRALDKEKPVNSVKNLLKYAPKISALYEEAISGARQPESKQTLTLVKGRIDMVNTKNLSSLLAVKFDRAVEKGDMVEIAALTKAEKEGLASDKAQLDKDYMLSLLDLFILHSNLPIVRDDLVFEKNKYSGVMTINGKKETFKLRLNKEKKILEIAINPKDIDHIQPREYKPVTIDHEIVRAIRAENKRIIESDNPDQEPQTVFFSFTKN